MERLRCGSRPPAKTKKPVTSFECPECAKVLSIGEIAEGYCPNCGNIRPREVRS